MSRSLATNTSVSVRSVATLVPPRQPLHRQELPTIYQGAVRSTRGNDVMHRINHKVLPVIQAPQRQCAWQTRVADAAPQARRRRRGRVLSASVMERISSNLPATLSHCKIADCGCACTTVTMLADALSARQGNLAERLCQGEIVLSILFEESHRSYAAQARHRLGSAVVRHGNSRHCKSSPRQPPQTQGQDPTAPHLRCWPRCYTDAGTVTLPTGVLKSRVG